MAVQVTFRFLEPSDWIGRLVTWRLHEPWSHVVIIIGDEVFSAQIPFVSMFTADHQWVAMPPRKGVDLTIECTDEEAHTIKDWCAQQLGNWYDIVSLFGWLLGLNWIQSKNRSYCFEFCRKPLVALGWLSPTKDLVKGSRLIAELKHLIAEQAEHPEDWDLQDITREGQ